MLPRNFARLSACAGAIRGAMRLELHDVNAWAVGISDSNATHENDAPDTAGATFGVWAAARTIPNQKGARRVQFPLAPLAS
eukprot:g1290.t1